MTYFPEVKNDLIIFDANNDKFFFDTNDASYITFFRIYSKLENVG